MDDEKKKSAVGQATGDSLKVLWKKLPLKVKLIIIGIPIGMFSLVVVIATVYQLFHGGFSSITGREPTETTIPKNEQDRVQRTRDFSGEEVYPGEELANDIYNSYYNEDGTLAIGAGLDIINNCDASIGLFEWIHEKVTGEFANVCRLVKFINDSAKEREKDYKKYDLKLDRGLVISTFIYAYAESTNQTLNEVASASDPISILTLFTNKAIEITDDSGKAVDTSDLVKITRTDIDNLFDAQIADMHFLKLTWKTFYQDIYYKQVPCPEGSEPDEICEAEDYRVNYMGCESVKDERAVFSLDKYKLYLRDMTKIIGGYAIKKSIKPYPPTMPYDENENGLAGLVGAMSYGSTLSATSGYCAAGTPVLSDKEKLAEHNGEHCEYHVASDVVCSNFNDDLVTMAESQAFIKDIVDNKKDDTSIFTSKTADYEDLNKEDDMTFTYNGHTLNINYDEGFINKFYDFTREEEIKRLRWKKIEKNVVLIVNNALAINQSLNFNYTLDDGTNGGNYPIVVGGEAAPLGDFKWIGTSPFGNRYHPLSGVYSMHNGIDMAGDIDGKAIYAWKDGTVSYVGWYGSGGNTIKITHQSVDGSKVESLYMHMKYRSTRKVGETVKAGDVIGYVGTTGGSTGPHLHFQIEVDGTPVDPCGYLKVGEYTCGTVAWR